MRMRSLKERSSGVGLEAQIGFLKSEFLHVHLGVEDVLLIHVHIEHFVLLADVLGQIFLDRELMRWSM